MMIVSKFMISDTQYLKINPECIEDDECKSCADIDIDYVDEEKNICIRFGYENARSFCYFFSKSGRIQKLINNQMFLDKTILGDPGIEWNKYFTGIRGKKETNIYHCFGNDHKQIYPYFDSWMYNDREGSVIFEITPCYPWHHEEIKLDPRFVPYKKFMKDYKPIVQTITPKENLKQWIKQAEMLDKMLICEDDQCC